MFLGSGAIPHHYYLLLSIVLTLLTGKHLGLFRREQKQIPATTES